MSDKERYGVVAGIGTQDEVTSQLETHLEKGWDTAIIYQNIDYKLIKNRTDEEGNQIPVFVWKKNNPEPRQ